MDPRLQAPYQRLQQLLGEYETISRQLDFDRLNAPGPNHTWSVAEIMFHMMDAEKGTVKSLQKKLLDTQQIPRAGIKSLYRFFLLRWALRSKRKYKAPKILAQPQGPYDRGFIFEQWILVRMALEQVLVHLPAHMVNKQLFKHPYVGGLNIMQTLRFMGDHMERHLRQISERLK